MNKDPYSIRTMRGAEIGHAIEWAAREGWNPGLHDSETYLSADANGFLIGAGRTHRFDLGCHSESLVHRLLHRQAGVSRHGLRASDLESCARIPRRLLYRIGWGRGPARQLPDIRVRARPSQCPLSRDRWPIARGRSGGNGFEPVPFERVREYEHPFFPADRSNFLKAWIGQREAIALGYVEGDDLAGYGVLRKCRSGYKVGPLFADSPARAETIFSALKSRAPEDAPVFLDIPEPNAAALELVRRHRMTPRFETARMYRGPRPDLPLERIFGITSFEIG
jgi:hypothetical protein